MFDNHTLIIYYLISVGVGLLALSGVRLYYNFIIDLPAWKNLEML